jgi:hypothetical protein
MNLENHLIFKHYLWTGFVLFPHNDPFIEIKIYLLKDPIISKDDAHMLLTPLENLTERENYLKASFYSKIYLFISFILLLIIFTYLLITSGPFAFIICFLFIGIASGISYWEYIKFKLLFDKMEAIVNKCNKTVFKNKGILISLPSISFWTEYSNEITIIKYNI